MSAVKEPKERIAFTLSRRINQELDALKQRTKISKSGLINRALEAYLAKEKEARIKRAVERMAKEYEATEMVVLDGEDFL